MQGDVINSDGSVSDGMALDILGDIFRMHPREEHKVGDLVVVSGADFRNLPAQGKPLLGSVGEFLDLHNSGYLREDGRYMKLAIDALRKVQGDAARAVLAFYMGPDFEPPSTKKRMRADGCDVVGMSGIEAFAATAEGIPFSHIALVTNPAFGLHDHHDNTAAGQRAADKIQQLAMELVKTYPSR